MTTEWIPTGGKKPILPSHVFVYVRFAGDSREEAEAYRDGYGQSVDSVHSWADTIEYRRKHPAPMTNDQTVTQAAHDCVAETIAQEIADHSPHGKKTDNYARIYQAAYLGAAKARKDLAAAHSGEGRSNDDVLRCDECGCPNPVWFAPSDVWNLAVGGPDATDDPGGVLCPICFIAKAEASGIKPNGWRIEPEGRSKGAGEDGLSSALAEHFPTGIRGLYEQSAQGIPVKTHVGTNCLCGWCTSATDEQEVREEWAAHVAAALSAPQGEVERLRDDETSLFREYYKGHHLDEAWVLYGGVDYEFETAWRERIVIDRATLLGQKLPADVVRLVIAARLALECQDDETLRELDAASEAFASRVPWDDEPEGDGA